MAVLIIGGTGFIGGRITKKLVEKGEKVVCFDLYPNFAQVDGLGEMAEVVVGDVTRIDDLLNVIKNFKVERIINLAALLVAESESHLIKALRLNLMGMMNVFEAAKLSGIKRVVYASSMAAYGPSSAFGDKKVDEDDICQPTTAYGAQKVWSEFMAAKYMAHHGMSMAGLRIAIVSGPGRKTGISAWSSTYVDLPAVGKPVEIPFRSDMKVLITYIEETADTFLNLVLADDLGFPVYNSLAYSISLGDLTKVVQKFIPDAKFYFNEQATDMPFVNDWSSRRLEEQFDWKVAPIEDMVRRHINEVRRKAGLSDL